MVLAEIAVGYMTGQDQFKVSFKSLFLFTLIFLLVIVLSCEALCKVFIPLMFNNNNDD